MAAVSASVLTDLDSSLQALLALKPPGVTKTRINAITSLCVENVKSESVLVQKIFTHFKKAPGTHKLGVLYVVDSVARQWNEKAGGGPPNDSQSDAPPDGTFAAGVQKIKGLFPRMLSSWIAEAPADQKEKMIKLLDIWERAQIYDHDRIQEFKKTVEEATIGPATSVENAALPSQPTINNPSAEVPLSASQVSSLLPSATTNPNAVAQPNSQNVSAQPTAGAAPPSLASILFGGSSNANIAPEMMSTLLSYIPPGLAHDPVALEKHITLLKTLAQNGVPPEQWKAITDAVSATAGPVPVQAAPPSTAHAFAQPLPQSQTSSRTRSRSPPRHRGSPVYGKFDNTNYRERSPVRSNSPSKQLDKISFDAEPKSISYDPEVPKNCIKVLSRTLFIGGTTASADELTQIFSQFGQVQSVIPNSEKRHAFIKYCRRAGAVNAIDSWKNVQDPNLTNTVRSVKWGVGFGPRECNEFATGVSVIPISKLTDADKRWILTAPYGGTGGKDYGTGTVMEEPDIEIGQGVSSKAISRRLNDHDSNRRPKGGYNDYPRNRQRSEHEQVQHQYPPQAYPAPMMGQPHDYGMPPAVPGFGFFGHPPSGVPPYG